MKLGDLIKKCPVPFSGIFNVCWSHCRVSTGGKQFLKFKISDESTEIPAIGWKNTYRGPQIIPNQSRVYLEGILRLTEWGYWIATILKATIITEEQNNCEGGQNFGLGPKGSELMSRLNRLGTPQLKQFVLSVLDNPQIVSEFSQLPASVNHHHCYQGGLLDHTLECWDVIDAHPFFHGAVKEIGLVAALFHDIGKTKTLTTQGKLQPEGFVVDHNAFTLEILGKHLAELEKSFPDGARALRYIWWWLGQGKMRGAPCLAIAEAVIAADRLSAANDAQKRAFRDKPHWHSHSKQNGYRYWRPRLPNEIEK